MDDSPFSDLPKRPKDHFDTTSQQRTLPFPSPALLVRALGNPWLVAGEGTGQNLSCEPDLWPWEGRPGTFT